MRPEVHLRPDRLRCHAVAAADLSDSLRAGVRAPEGGLPEDPSVAAELDRLRTAVRRAVRELDELAAALAAAAASAESADADAARGFGCAADRP